MWPFSLVSGDVEAGAEAEDADGVGAEFPRSVGVGDRRIVEVVVGRVGVVVDAGAEGGAGVVGVGVFERPELPAHLELVGHVVVELFSGFGDGALDGGVGGAAGGIDFGTVDSDALAGVDVDALVGGGSVKLMGYGGRGGDALAADYGELAEDASERRGQGFEPEIGEPETEVEAICHDGSFYPPGGGNLAQKRGFAR